jgi:hypothetical protein
VIHVNLVSKLEVGYLEGTQGVFTVELVGAFGIQIELGYHDLRGLVV